MADPEVGLMGGSEITFDLTLPADRTAHLGMVAANDCAQIAAAAIGLESGPATLTIPEAGRDDPNCSNIGAGYVYVYAMDDTTEPAEADPISMPAAIELPYLTVVPIFVQTESGETATTTPEPSAEPDVLAVSCYGDPTTQLDATEVAAAPDGVHLLVRSTVSYVEVQIDDDFIRIEDSPRELVLDLAPGEHGVQCIAPGADQVWDPIPFEVVDPNGYWLDPSVDCAPPADIVDLDADVITVEGDPRGELLAVGESLFSEEGEATIGGYPESLPDRSVIMLNEDGSVIGRANFHLDERGWFVDSYVTCEGTTIT
jgi:hypothetical protein